MSCRWDRVSSTIAPVVRETSRRATLIRSALLVLALVVVVGIGWVRQHPTESAPKFCTAEGLVGNDGKVYGRDQEHDCAFVDEHGRPLPVDRNGTPIAP